MTDAATGLALRNAVRSDLVAIARIHRDGIEDRIATLDEDVSSEADFTDWYLAHEEPYGIVVAERDGSSGVVGWASLNAYSHRCAYRGVADLSIYVSREARGSGVGTALMHAIERLARRNAFHKIVLFALAENRVGERLYRNMGYRNVGVFKEQGRLEGRFVDVIAMEKILKPRILFVCKHNTGRSQMAEAFLHKLLGDDVDVSSAGTQAGERPDPGVVAAMAEIGIDISAARPKLLSSDIIANADRVITMGCDVEGVPHIDADWALPDPKGQSPERVREIRNLVYGRAADLVRELRNANA